ncbi:MAG: hypothetical protein V1792_10930 [Pseudomonadota bacterium]
MPEKDLPSFDSVDENETAPDHSPTTGLGTQTIDLSNLFSSGVYSSGTFDLSVASTSFGRLLDALPVPAILIDESNTVVFSNHGCAKLTSDYQDMYGVSFLDFLPRPSDLEKAQVLADKTLALLERVFRTRRPLTAEAILEIHRKRIWARLNLRAVRIASERYVLVLIDDVTSEKKQLELNRRRDKESEEMRRNLEALVDMANSELSAINAQLRSEITDHLRTQSQLRVERQKCSMLAQISELATAVAAPDGIFQSMDPRFEKLCGYELHEVPNLRELMIGSRDDADSPNETSQAWLDGLDGAMDQGTTAAAACALACRDSTSRGIRVKGLRLEDGNYFIACQEE